jgi:hypothetical protein
MKAGGGVLLGESRRPDSGVLNYAGRVELFNRIKLVEYSG